ncbi:MAG: hypothetical protein U1D55_08165 [Phycisphaerae bacterium]
MRHMIRPLSTLVVALTTFAAFAAPSEKSTLTPVAELSWDQIVAQDAFVDSSARKPEATPYMPGPAPHVAAQSFILPGDQPPMPQPVLRGICPISALEPSLSTNFQGLGDNNTRIPPDTMGAVGPNHVMTMINTQVRIHNRSGGTISTVNLSTFWASVSTTAFDPRLLYDAQSGRWISCCATNSRAASSSVGLAVSNTSDPTGTWRFYNIDADSSNVNWIDYPTLGVNRNWIAVTGNMFTVAADAFSGAKMWVIDKTAAGAGTLTVTTFPVAFDTAGGTNGFTLQPCVTLDPLQNTLYLVDNSGDNDPVDGVQLIRISQITGPVGAPVWSVVPGSAVPGTGQFRVPTDFVYGLLDAPQLGDARLIETNDPRVQGNAIFRNGHIWFAHPGGAPITGNNRTNAYWYEVNPAAMPTPVVQQGIIDGGAGVHHSFPSLGVNCNGDVCIGFSRADATRFIEAAYAVHLSIDPPGFTRPVRVLKAGLSSYFKQFSGTRNRWGDYSATMVDPNDDLSFWILQEYAEQRVGPTDNDSRWGVWWGKLAPSCSGDLNGDRTVDSADLGILLAAWMTTSAGDLNGDGLTNEADLGIILGNWLVVCP